MKAGKDIRAGAYAYGNGISADAKGVVSKGLILGKQDIKAENLILGVKGARSNVDIVADNNLVAKKATQTQTLRVTKNSKFFGNIEVNNHATFGSATIKGKLYV